MARNHELIVWRNLNHTMRAIWRFHWEATLVHVLYSRIGSIWRTICNPL